MNREINDEELCRLELVFEDELNRCWTAPDPLHGR
jgi:hypothetical protein